MLCSFICCSLYLTMSTISYISLLLLYLPVFCLLASISMDILKKRLRSLDGLTVTGAGQLQLWPIASNVSKLTPTWPENLFWTASYPVKPGGLGRGRAEDSAPGPINISMPLSWSLTAPSQGNWRAGPGVDPGAPATGDWALSQPCHPAPHGYINYMHKFIRFDTNARIVIIILCFWIQRS